MNTQQEHYSQLIKAFLPEQVFDYFTITDVKINQKSIEVNLEELNQPPALYKEEKLITKGFHPSVTIQDFPIRDKSVYLHVRRRKLQVTSSGKVVSNTWDLSANGTRYTKGFASFLKGLFGQLPDQ